MVPDFDMGKRLRIPVVHFVLCLLAAILGLALLARLDIVTTRFKTLAEAEKQGAFERGWLPPILPGSAVEIEEVNNLDLNLGTGSFRYDISERASYIARLQAFDGVFPLGGDGEEFTIVNERGRWIIRLPPDEGAGAYEMGLSSIRP